MSIDNRIATKKTPPEQKEEESELSELSEQKPTILDLIMTKKSFRNPQPIILEKKKSPDRII